LSGLLGGQAAHGDTRNADMTQDWVLALRGLCQSAVCKQNQDSDAEAEGPNRGCNCFHNAL
jgi:hypothetical protein